jgi:hypothetical protein
MCPNDRMPRGVDWPAVMYLDAGFLHFHIIDINTDEPKMHANKLHAGKEAVVQG